MTGADDIRPPSMLPAFLTLFTSTGTLICCALPALLVSIGAGAVMAGLVEAVPQITWIGKHKTAVFALAGILLVISGAWQWHARSLPCPVDKAQATACARARQVSWIVWGLSVALYATGFFFAFLAASIFY
ncbi:hypothetical protein [Hyphomonas sp.]|uniref:hypothetical protein n=1 Tax=Hyphomonas sp. TaxID=87 RepID=UPI00334294FD